MAALSLTESAITAYYSSEISKLMKKKFSVLVEKDEDGYLVATVPTLPGCHTQARSMDDLLERAKEAIEAYLEAYTGPRCCASKEEVISDAVKAFFKQRPELKKEIATGSTKDQEMAEKPPIEDRMKILESYVGIVKLKKPFTLAEILVLEEDNWLY
jgi:predicted RNase H-like HicB family nuclease